MASGRAPSVRAANLKSERANKAVSNLLYSCGLSFNIRRNPAFEEAFQAARKAPPGWKPPSYNALRTSMLDEEEVVPWQREWEEDSADEEETVMGGSSSEGEAWEDN
ncbi:hypothetical protein GPECTOR_16g769 [Gonium pectorale]|uniref:Uncharacterized protein n=1 Tax=Gonium pectorale TaxID=33097 RepID=A0A150GLB4_GONPE|nr:hypothetical protein GPECTOR_16g769 [Gonium pectorale]|eukprot:KXZ50594.1 hypothetical protein GPECTOR_16g769 [Gonium pectorale]